jgi:hypothetical protein
MQARGRYGSGMKLPIMILLAATAASPAFAQGAIGTVERGRYVCELPGDAASRAGVEQPGENFVIESASRYSSAQGAGTYLRRGNTLTFTSGPRQGESFAIVSPAFMRRTENGRPGRLRGVRSGR